MVHSSNLTLTVPERSLYDELIQFDEEKYSLVHTYIRVHNNSRLFSMGVSIYQQKLQSATLLPFLHTLGQTPIGTFVLRQKIF